MDEEPRTPARRQILLGSSAALCTLLLVGIGWWFLGPAALRARALTPPQPVATVGSSSVEPAHPASGSTPSPAAQPPESATPAAESWPSNVGGRVRDAQ